MAEQPPWEDLPPLCWEAVLRSLSSNADLQSFSSVCKRLLDISNAFRTSLAIPNQLTPYLDSLLSRRVTSLKSINLSPFCGNPSSVLRQIAQFPLPLERLDLSNQESLRFDGLRQMGSKFGALRVLVLSKIRLLGDDDLVSIAGHFPLLEELDISYPRRSRKARVTDDGISVLSQTLQRLSRIDISGNQSVSDQSLVVVAVNCPCLREIWFRDCGLITGRGIASLIKKRPQLVSLALIDMEEETIFCEELVDSFRHAEGLSHLDFSGSFIWDELLMSVAKANIPLECLDLSDASGFSFNGIRKIVLKHRGIKVLDLEGARFLTDGDMSVVCKDLGSLTSINVSRCINLTKTTLYNLTRQCPLLKRIFMERTNLRKDDANETDIVVNSQVRSLIIPSNENLTDECLKKIGRMCPNLWYLDVGVCLKITGDGISGVLKRCPEIKHLDMRGLKNIGSLSIDFELPQLEGLQAGGLKLNDEQLAAFISRCCHLEHLDLQKCVHLSTKGVEMVVKNCKTLRKINLGSCHNVRDDVPFLDWMVSVRPSLRRIVPPCGLISSEIQDLFLQRGCLVCDD
ncbi:F-box/LRR-repeat protein 7-like isoform X2 [Rhodamnia argentea]|uniref:F-box/LRR-repeat protein 7-like isoform X2 n=1 Tax=Rhodamnia argentea TaxID=178133 RepID=A0ABM3H7L0_9MYRT|nr:F-box/LRR-repeat protein 7-like isoform X2 [Rhodamnia argentea]